MIYAVILSIAMLLFMAWADYNDRKKVEAEHYFPPQTKKYTSEKKEEKKEET